VGVVADSLYEGPREGVRRQVFWPGPSGSVSNVIYMRTRTTSTASSDLARRKVAELDATMPVFAVKTVESQLDETLLTDRLVATLSAGFGLLATFLAAIGLYGVMAFVVARRRKELGIRIALGASAGSVQWMVIREVLLLLGIGLVVGVPAALGLGGYLSSQLYGLQPRDPVIAITMVALLATASILAGFIPALRASRIDPIGALRHE
jgi:ABC-type antimicrobial peptide transport system permease subunit